MPFVWRRGGITQCLTQLRGYLRVLQPRLGVRHRWSKTSKFRKWLGAACEYAIRNNTPGERSVFVNALNKWAEGAHLEPDWYNGDAYPVETGEFPSR